MENFEDIQDAIKTDLKAASPEKKDEAFDERYIISRLDWEDAEIAAYSRRNDLYSDILEEYISINKAKSKANKHYKFWFFLISMIVFAALAIGPIVVFINIAGKECATITDLATVLGCITGIITSIIVIPKIIAKHLFPTDEDTHMIEMVKNMQINDSKIRTTYTGKQGTRK